MGQSLRTQGPSLCAEPGDSRKLNPGGQSAAPWPSDHPRHTLQASRHCLPPLRGWQGGSLPWNAVGSGQHPLGVDEGPPTLELPLVCPEHDPQAHLPWPLPSGGIVPPHNAHQLSAWAGVWGSRGGAIRDPGTPAQSSPWPSYSVPPGPSPCGDCHQIRGMASQRPGSGVWRQGRRGDRDSPEVTGMEPPKQGRVRNSSHSICRERGEPE